MRFRVVILVKTRRPEVEMKRAPPEEVVAHLQDFISGYVPFIGLDMEVMWEPAPKCVRCGRELVVPQLLDHMDRPEGTVCMVCMGWGLHGPGQT